MGFGLRPDDEDIGDRRVGDPHFRAGEAVAALGFLGAGLHARRVRTRIGFGQAETADPLARGQLRQVFLALLLRAIGVDRIHHEARLHRHHRAVAAIDPLYLARDQAVGHIASADPAIFLGDRGAKQTHLAHLAEDRRVGGLILEGLDHARLQLVLCIGAGRIAQHPLVFAQLGFETQRVVPGELAQIGGILGFERGAVGHGGSSGSRVCCAGL